MKTFSISGFILLLFLLSCEKGKDNLSIQYEAKIVGFDANCGTCIVSFPDDLIKVKALAGESPDNYYQIVNLKKSNFRIGQKLIVEVRKAEDTELPGCITLYESSNYKNLYVLDYRNYSDLVLNDTIELSYKDCLNDTDMQSYICLDSVISDSRCPEGVQCVWAGEATARFKFEKYNSSPVFIGLKEGTKDTLINGYKFSFLQLLPYPKYGTQIKPEDYKARIIIKNQ